MKKLVWIMAKSAKHSASCIAGFELLVTNNDWSKVEVGNLIRLVSTNDGGSVPEINLLKGSRWGFMESYDIIECDVIKGTTIGAQSENFIINTATIKWINRAIPTEQFICDKVSNDLFINNNNRLNRIEYSTLENSFRLVKVNNLTIVKNDYNKVKCNFDFEGRPCYGFAMTDPLYYGLAYPYRAGSAYIIISTSSEVYDQTGCAYKFVAKIIPEGVYSRNIKGQ
ncbi:MAG: hypothetical protein LBN08_07455 [Lactobacillales bacterium]|jgi:hypothetical protein|nr:hypothetical protein [Lactobacillales bacterium]